MGNRYQLVVDLPESDGILTEGDLHLAEIAKGEMVAALKGRFPEVDRPDVHVMMVPVR